MRPGDITAAGAGLLSCLTCGLLSQPASHEEDANACPRCGRRLHVRKPHSLLRSWTFLVAAMVLYLPANLLPIMDTESLIMGSHSDTIMSGIVLLWKSGSWGIAIIVFIASIMVPMLKMLAMLVILVAVHQGVSTHCHDLARLYRILEIIGRWSMLDVFVVAILVTLVQLQLLAAITPAKGALAFGAVVVLTMLSTMSFDPRLIWDSAEHARRRPHG
ncbi:MAG TPA: paraquat-inducible protein A [Burkholderiales bacterium]|jgi:paraquat-inducible protein A|nr:paraquat-inducible protein A [Burkholderiales bacterium]